MSNHHIEIPAPEELSQLPPDGGEKWNRLVFEESPYLLQHAANPVDWYPWGDEAFERAAKEDKPIFLSIGYATCHWCHVMARESFEDDEVAALLNNDFISVKVDREERPDIDKLHMTACQALTGTGGWPLTCFLTPEGEVFYTGTYFPKYGRYGRPGMIKLLPGMSQNWNSRRDEILKNADYINKQLQEMSRLSSHGDLTGNIEEKAYDYFKNSFDEKNGGFGEAPKFPTPHQYLFLLRYWFHRDEHHALEMVEKSLRKMRMGGLYDQIGFGFHRYSTDDKWLLPHFEKMLYDQAMLLLAYGETYAATGDEFFRKTSKEIVEYLAYRMKHPEGGFYSAEDADSEGEEGKFYLWHLEEVSSILEKDELEWFTKNFNVSRPGNFTDESTGKSSGANIPHLSEIPEGPADPDGNSSEDWHARRQVIRQKLFLHREKRIHPLLDDKILTDWNGLLIAALARVSLNIDCSECLQMAEGAFRYIIKHLLNEKGELQKRIRTGKGGLPAHLDDYAFMIRGALELHQATLNIDYLQQGIQWMNMAIEKFWDSRDSGFFFSEVNSELSVRTKEAYDGALPSGNSVMAANLAHLFHLTGEETWQKYFDKLVSVFASQINKHPHGYTYFLTALDLMNGTGKNLVFAGPGISSEILAPLKCKFFPDTVWLAVNENNLPLLRQLAPFAAEYGSNDETLYLCRDFACDKPVTGKFQINEKLKNLIRREP